MYQNLRDNVKIPKTAKGIENVLPNAMLRDILVQNSQAAKSDEIMNKLEERWEPMPDYMKEEIETGITIVGGREQLEAKRDGWLQKESYLFNQVISNYLSDTTNPNAINELKVFLQNENSIVADFVLADICIQHGDFTEATNVLSSMQTSYTLTSNESQLANDYLSISEILTGLQTDSISSYALDSIHAVPLFTLYNSDENSATNIARDILICSGLLEYQEPINGGDVAKSAVAENPAIKPVNSSKRVTEQLSVFPNPASTYTIIEYMVVGKAPNAAISICNLNGIEVWKKEIGGVKGQIVVDLNSFSPGVYMVTLKSGKQTYSKKTLTIAK